MNAFPNYSIAFHIYTDASGDFQLGVAIMQKNKPIAYYSKELTPAHVAEKLHNNRK